MTVDTVRVVLDENCISVLGNDSDDEKQIAY